MARRRAAVAQGVSPFVAFDLAKVAPAALAAVAPAISAAPVPLEARTRTLAAARRGSRDGAAKTGSPAAHTRPRGTSDPARRGYPIAFSSRRTSAKKGAPNASSTAPAKHPVSEKLSHAVSVPGFGPGPPGLHEEPDLISCGPGLDRVEAHP